MLYRVAQIQLSMLFPLFSNWTLPLTPSALYAHRQTDSLRLCCPPPPKPSQTHRHTHSPPPKPKLLPILPIVQCSPFQPGLHSHLPSLQVPCSLQRGWHALWSHPVPIQPSSQRQLPDTQMPWPPQSAAQISVGDRDTEKDKKREWGKTDRKEGRGVEVGWKGKTRRWRDKATRVKKRQIQELLSRKGGHASLPCLMAVEKKFLHLIRGNPFWQYKSNKSITKKGHGLWRP